jgi:hypothetical protein
VSAGRLAVAVGALVLALGCASGPAPSPAPPPAPAASAVPEGSDLCYLVVREAVAKPDLDVDRVPTPVKLDPPPFKPPYPRGVLGKGGTMDIAIEVMVDTLGKADMSTFKVVKTSHPWFATRLKAAVSKWTFEPAVKAGCKVPRVYKLGISAPPKKAG